MENELKSSSNILSDVLERIPALVVVYDVENDNYAFINRQIEKLLGYQPEKFIGKSFLQLGSELIHPDDLPKVLSRNRGLLVSGQGGMDRLPTSEYRVKHKDGHWVWIRSEGMVYQSLPDGRAKTVINLLTDMTSAKQYEERLKKQAEDLRELNRTKDEFISIASHQLRTPATAVKQYLGLLLGGYSDPLTEDQKNFIQRAYDSNNRELTIVEDILRTAQVDANKLRLQFAMTDIVELVDEAVKNISSKLEKKSQQLVWNRPEKPVKLRVDRGQLLMVVENLLENASNYTQEGKRITVSLAKLAETVEISVVDQGVGISQSDIKKLFQKFSRISNALTVQAGGSGLGLYWAEKVIKLHKGEIRVRSALGKGTEFVITLPVDQKRMKQQSLLPEGD